MKKLFIILTLALGLFSISEKNFCQTTQTTNESFETFYQKFYSDSVFQNSRINWPLEGEASVGDFNEVWTKSTWKRFLKNPKSVCKDFNLFSLIKKDDSNYIQNTGLNNSGWGINYKYKKINGKWFLTYYNVFSN